MAISVLLEFARWGGSFGMPTKSAILPIAARHRGTKEVEKRPLKVRSPLSALDRNAATRCADHTMPQSGQDSGFWLVFADLYDGFNFKKSAANITNMKQKIATLGFTKLAFVVILLELRLNFAHP
jgi:hypothetical protein